MVVVSIAFAAAALLACSGTTHAWAAGTFSDGDEQLLFALTNQDRASAGLSTLVDDGYLHSEARWRAKDMGDRNYFSHEIPPDGRMVFDYMQSDGYCFRVAGENIGLTTFGDSDATTTLEQAFLGSPEHRDNIMGGWTNMSVGAYEAPDGRKLYSVLFSIPCGAVAPTPTPVPTPVATPVPAPTARPTVKPSPSVSSTASVSPSATASPEVTVAPTVAPTVVPTVAPTVVPSSAPSSATDGGDTVPSTTAGTAGTATTLRVREKSTSRGPIDSLLNSLFGGLFGL
jgi:uncharacterized protein YkwD